MGLKLSESLITKPTGAAVAILDENAKQHIEGHFEKCAETGEVTLNFDDDDVEKFPADRPFKIVLQDGNDSQYFGVFDKEGVFQVVGS